MEQREVLLCFDYLSSITCKSDTGLCRYYTVCPLSNDKATSCIVLKKGPNVFKSFVNLFIGGREGKENEMNKCLFELVLEGNTTDTMGAIAKSMSVLYGPEKSTDKGITAININVAPINSSTIERKVEVVDPEKEKEKKIKLIQEAMVKYNLGLTDTDESKAKTTNPDRSGKARK